jgi:1,4-dihydroxy-2-naphthoyl-CoA synthase
LNTLRAVVYQDEPARTLNSVEALDQLLLQAAAEAQAAGRLNVIFLYGAHDDELTLVVGGDETVLGFTDGHGDPPYYSSEGAVEGDDPVLTAYISLEHHTEFPRRYVVSMALGRSAAAEFLATGRRPASVRWAEV